MLLVAAACRVVGEDPTLSRRFIPAGEQGHDDQALHGEAEVQTDHRCQSVRLADQG